MGEDREKEVGREREGRERRREWGREIWSWTGREREERTKA